MMMVTQRWRMSNGTHDMNDGEDLQACMTGLSVKCS